MRAAPDEAPSGQQRDHGPTRQEERNVGGPAPVDDLLCDRAALLEGQVDQEEQADDGRREGQTEQQVPGRASTLEIGTHAAECAAAEGRAAPGGARRWDLRGRRRRRGLRRGDRWHHGRRRGRGRRGGRRTRMTFRGRLAAHQRGRIAKCGGVEPEPQGIRIRGDGGRSWLRVDRAHLGRSTADDLLRGRWRPLGGRRWPCLRSHTRGRVREGRGSSHPRDQEGSATVRTRNGVPRPRDGGLHGLRAVATVRCRGRRRLRVLWHVSHLLLAQRKPRSGRVMAASRACRRNDANATTAPHSIQEPPQIRRWRMPARS